MDTSKFSSLLRHWYSVHKRDLPWRKTRDPYAIWLSEIILQQTRVDQGMSYYLKFIEQHPNVLSLAQASESEILSLWQGLGYYSRARNMHKAARLIAEKGGDFPSTFAEILELPGVGPYTAAAIASFAFDLPHAVVDGNVIRVISRLYGLDAPVNTTEVQKEITRRLEEIFDRNDPATFNQAIMEFGALHCRVSNPLCPKCPFMEECQAHRLGQTGLIPYKLKKSGKRSRYFNYLVLENDRQVILKKRKGRDIWENMYDFPLQEESAESALQPAKVSEELPDYLPAKSIKSRRIKHVLSHQDIHARFYRFRVENLTQLLQKDWEVVDKDKLSHYPVPKLIENYLIEF